LSSLVVTIWRWWTRSSRSGMARGSCATSAACASGRATRRACSSGQTSKTCPQHACTDSMTPVPNDSATLPGWCYWLIVGGMAAWCVTFGAAAVLAAWLEG
jgi:hypothetical protein